MAIPKDVKVYFQTRRRNSFQHTIGVHSKETRLRRLYGWEQKYTDYLKRSKQLAPEIEPITFEQFKTIAKTFNFETMTVEELIEDIRTVAKSKNLEDTTTEDIIERVRRRL